MSEPKSYPTIADAKALATKHRRRGVIVLSFGAGDYHAASYGMTRADCLAMAGVVEQICDGIASGMVEIPAGFGREPASEERAPVDTTGYEVAAEWRARCKAAEAERDRLAARVAELDAALRPFAEYAEHLNANTHPDVMGVGYYRDPNITVGDCRRAAELLKESPA